MGSESGFDEYADDYEAALGQGLALSGESSSYFAKGRIDWLNRRLHDMGEHSRVILDFGCGTGLATSLLFELTDAQRVIGVDVSERSLKVARSQGDRRLQFFHADAFDAAGDIDIAYCNGVFHHIPLAERAGAVNRVHESLRKGGMFALFENNPWNPGTRWIMSRIPFDRDAQMLSAWETKRMLRDAGFEIVCTDFLFIFPNALRFLRFLEPSLTQLPLGGQYMVLARKTS